MKYRTVRASKAEGKFPLNIENAFYTRIVIRIARIRAVQDVGYYSARVHFAYGGTRITQVEHQAGERIRHSVHSGNQRSKVNLYHPSRMRYLIVGVILTRTVPTSTREEGAPAPPVMEKHVLSCLGKHLQF